MSEREQTRLGPAEEKARREVRALSQPVPASDYRERMKRAFADGTIDSALEPPRAPSRRAGLWSWGVGLAAAAALLLAVNFLNRGPAWEVAQVTGEGEILVDARAFDAAGGGPTAESITPGATVHASGEAQIDLICPGTIALQLPPGTRVTIPNSPGRWFGRESRCELTQGELRLVTGPSFPGARLLIAAPHAEIEITATTVAVIAGADSTCLCVLDGTAKMTRLDGSVETVAAGNRLTVFTAARDPFEEEILPMERMKLQMLQDQAGPTLRDAP